MEKVGIAIALGCLVFIGGILDYLMGTSWVMFASVLFMLGILGLLVIANSRKKMDE